MSPNLINIIFGMKVRQARTEAGLNLSEFAAQCDLSPSYVTEIEKGRKYPRADKIMKIAETLGKDYDDLVSIKLAPSLTYLESALSSTILQKFPFAEFGLESGDLVNLLTREPERASALLHAILEMIRRYDVKEEDFLRAALRSYQEIHENYFQDLEEAALAFTAEFGQQYQFGAEATISLEALQQILTGAYQYRLDYETLGQDAQLAYYRSVYAPGKRPRLLLNNQLYSRQIRFLLARELGYQYLGIEERSATSTPDEVHSFRQLLNDFRAAYFAGALLIPQAAVLSDLRPFFAQPTWQPQALVAMLTRYDVTPEMLFYRFSELIPQHFGIPIHFLRFHQVGDSYRLMKHLNMNQLMVPSGLGLDEHYCRRWLSVRLLHEMSTWQNGRINGRFPPPEAQIARFHNTDNQFLSFGFARSLVLTPGVNSSVTVGFRLTPELERVVAFLADPAIPHTVINETCERCPLTAVECTVRAAPPLALAAAQADAARKATLQRVMNQRAV